MSKVLVIYYSFEGTTEIIAHAIAKETNGDLLSIKPLNELKSTGFSKYLWGGSQVFMKKKPELVEFEKDLKDYDTIYIGTPIWAGTFAPPIKTLFENEHLIHKNIYFFYTHDGGPGRVEKFARLSIKSNNTFCGSKGFLTVKKDLDLNLLEVKNWIASFKL